MAIKAYQKCGNHQTEEDKRQVVLRDGMLLFKTGRSACREMKMFHDEKKKAPPFTFHAPRAFFCGAVVSLESPVAAGVGGISLIVSSAITGVDLVRAVNKENRE